ncbi:hypothetical protein D6D06_08546 [Aureobasidium pullulans]|nr:hypothetical protein D6D06_08546 [Aureobasidium pullulans]
MQDAFENTANLRRDTRVEELQSIVSLDTLRESNSIVHFYSFGLANTCMREATTNEEKPGPGLASRWANEHGQSPEKKLSGLASRAWGLESHNERKQLQKWLAKMDEERQDRTSKDDTGDEQEQQQQHQQQQQQQQQPGRPWVSSGLTRLVSNFKPGSKVQKKDEERKEAVKAEKENKQYS